MDETGLAFRTVGHRSGIAGGDFDEIAEYIVVLDLERADAGVFGILQLQAGDDAARLVAQRPHLVEFGIGPFAQEPAVPFQKRQFVGEHVAQLSFKRRRQSSQIGKRLA